MRSFPKLAVDPNRLIRNLPYKIHIHSFSSKSIFTRDVSLVPVSLYYLPAHSQPSTPILNLLPILLPKRRIRLIPRRNPQEMIIPTIRHLRPNKLRVHSLVTQRNLILLMVMDVRGVIDYTQENGHCVTR